MPDPPVVDSYKCYNGACLQGVHSNCSVNNVQRDGRSDSVSYTEYAEVSVYGHVVRLGLNGAVLVSLININNTSDCVCNIFAL